jgi:hypothetical protein
MVSSSISIAVALLVLASSCSLRPLESDRVFVKFSATQSRPIDLNSLMNGVNRLADVWRPFAPLYPCVGVNVVGYGIPNAGRGDEDVVERLQGLYQGGSCTYQGVFRGMVPTSGSSSIELSLDVPTGPNRIIQIGGTDDLVGGQCDPTGESDMDIFEWGRATLDLFGSTLVQIAEHPGSVFGDEAKRMNCEDEEISMPSGLVLRYHAQPSQFTASVSNGTAINASWINSQSGGVPALPPQAGLPLFFSGEANNNNQPFIQASGTSPSGFFITSNNEIPAGLTAFSAYVVASTPTSSSHRFMCISGAPGSCQGTPVQPRFHLYSAGGTQFTAKLLDSASGSLEFIASNLLVADTQTAWAVFEVIFDGTSFLVRRNNLVGSGSNLGSLGAFSLSGGDIMIGASEGQTSNGAKIAEVLFFSRALNPAEATGLREDLMSKYGISP